MAGDSSFGDEPLCAACRPRLADGRLNGDADAANGVANVTDGFHVVRWCSGYGERVDCEPAGELDMIVCVHTDHVICERVPNGL